jgi:hypothetical protein
MKCKERGNTHKQKLMGMTKRNVKREKTHMQKVKGMKTKKCK